MLADLIDVQVRAQSRKGTKPKPYPRPNDKKNAHRVGRATRPQGDIRAALAARGHTIVDGG